MFIDPDTSAETPVKFRFEYNSDEEAFGFRNEQNMFVSFKSGGDTSDATAYPQHILSGYTAYARGEKITGNIIQRSASNETLVGSKTYNSGYYPTQWTVTSLDTSDATAKAKNIETGYTAYVNGVKITGIATGIVHELSKVNDGLIANLSGASNYFTQSASVGDYALIFINSSVKVIAYDYSLSQSSAPNRSQTCYGSLSASIGNYALFCGGVNVSTYYNTVDAYDTSLTKSNPAALSTTKNNFSTAAANTYDYVLLAGGTEGIDIYNSLLTHSVIDALDTSAYSPSYFGAASIGDYALFGGGHYYIAYTFGCVKTVYAYNSSLTKSTPQVLSSARTYVAGGNIGNYALFVGGTTNVSTPISSNVVDIYSSNLAKSVGTSLTYARDSIISGRLDDYILFAGGRQQTTGNNNQRYNMDVIETFNNSLVKSSTTSMSVSRICDNTGGSAASVGNYVLFTGFTDVVDGYVST